MILPYSQVPRVAFSFNTAGSPWCGILPKPLSQETHPYCWPSPLEESLSHQNSNWIFRFMNSWVCPRERGWLASPTPGNLVVEALASLPSLCDSRADLLFRCWKYKLFLIPTFLSQWRHHTQAASDMPSYLRSPYHVLLTWEWIGVEHMVGNSNLILLYFKKASDKTRKKKTQTRKSKDYARSKFWWTCLRSVCLAYNDPCYQIHFFSVYLIKAKCQTTSSLTKFSPA